MERRYFVYILSSRARTLYTGVTNNLERRLQQHREGGSEGGFTRKYRVKNLVHYEIFNDVRRAIAREKQIKGWLRSRKIALVERFNPGWKDLSAEWRRVRRKSPKLAAGKGAISI